MLSHLQNSDTTGYLDADSWKEYHDTLFGDDSRADLVVALARKMPRILEYLGNLQDTPCPVVTERALPWIVPTSLRNGSVIICDDVLNIGTTLKHYVDYSFSCGFRDVRAMVFAKKEKSSASCAPINVSVGQYFDELQYWRFETALPQELQKIGKPYEVDFPIIDIPIPEELANLSPEEWYNLFETKYCSVHNLTTPSQRQAGITSISIIEPLLSIENSHQYRRDMLLPSIVKVRIYISRECGLIRIVPMYVRVIGRDELETSTHSICGKYTDLYRETKPIAREGKPFTDEPIFILATYLYSFAYGKQFVDRLCVDIPILPRNLARISYFDIQLLFGPAVARDIHSRLQRDLEEIEKAVNIQSQFTSPTLPPSPIK